MELTQCSELSPQGLRSPSSESLFAVQLVRLERPDLVLFGLTAIASDCLVKATAHPSPTPSPLSHPYAHTLRIFPTPTLPLPLGLSFRR